MRHLNNETFAHIIEHTPLIAIDMIICRADQKEIRNTHVNIGTGVETSIKELSEMIKGVVGYQGELFFNSDKPDGTMRKLTDPSKLHSLGWHHQVELEEGISRIYQWYLGNSRKYDKNS